VGKKQGGVAHPFGEKKKKKRREERRGYGSSGEKLAILLKRSTLAREGGK